MKLRRLTWLGLLLSSPAWASGPCPAEAQARLLAEVAAQARAALALDGTQLELSPIGELPALATAQVRVLGQSLRSRLAVELKGTRCSDGKAQTGTVWFKASAWREAWVYGRNARAEQPVSETAPRRERIDIAALQLLADDLPERLDGLWLNQSANAGMPVLKRHLQSEPLVQRNALVAVIVQGPGLQLRTQGKAMRQGLLGDNIPVLVDGAESSLMAVVAGKGEVHVQH
ncbi:flagellar basal body P-ring formation chaperone FlgA [Pseudomonas japonica]|uniref:flagellar basal body P-ring formation chaperone FlgA n=1 Tax=Pseudomonas japonica TaxID=256466 RepID=UPI00382DD7A6